ncbi:opioid growth factor receptor conserved region-domain-containing protein [Trichophaea hybrida]|nr:opioid growth factor receptor conserved region-domain-containing protein [Trichophaea hybrida]
MSFRHRPTDPTYLSRLPPVTSPTPPVPLPNTPLIRFYSPLHAGVDSRGRTLNIILSFPDQRLEYLHDYIQWLFPLPEASPFNYSAPVLYLATISAFRSSPVLRSRIRESFVRMLKFYGFKYDEEGGVVIDTENWDKVARNWWRKFDHNHLRITRMIRSLRVLGLEKEAVTFYRELVRASLQVGKGPGQTSLMFWRRAAKRPLQVTPEDEAFDDDDETSDEEGEEEENEQEEGNEEEAEVEDDKNANDDEDAVVEGMKSEDNTDKESENLAEHMELPTTSKEHDSTATSRIKLKRKRDSQER